MPSVTLMRAYYTAGELHSLYTLQNTLENHGRKQDFFPAWANSQLGVARIFSEGATFFPQKVDVFLVVRRPHNTDQNY